MIFNMLRPAAISCASLAVYAICGSSALAQEPAAAVSARLAIFDLEGSGDRDGRVEWPDLHAETVAAHIAGGKPEARLLRDALLSLSNLHPSCIPQDRHIDADAVRCVFGAVAKSDPSAIAPETLSDQIGALRTDSLRGVHDGADPTATEEWRWANLIVSGLGVPAYWRVQSGFVGGFPTDPDRIETWFPGYFSVAMQLTGSLACGGKFSDQDALRSRVSIRGRTSATLHEALSSPIGLNHFHSPGMLFMHGESLGPEDSLIETGVRYIELQSKRQDKAPGGFFLASYGANDLFTFRHIVVGAPEVTAAAFRADLERLDNETARLIKLGVRRVYVLPPPVDALLVHHPVPKDARFSDGSIVPPGSVVLHHWLLAANAGRRLPRHVVLTQNQLKELHDRQDRFVEAANDVLGKRSNWLVIDTRALFMKLLDAFYAGFPPIAAPGYGRIEYAGTTALLSTDSVHPTELGYLLWAGMVLEELRESGVALSTGSPATPWQPRTIEEKADAVLARVREQIINDPSGFRPHRFPADPSWAPRIHALVLDAKAFDHDGDDAWSRVYADASWVWPYVDEDLLREIAPRIDPAALDTSCGHLQHHEIVARLRRVLEAPNVDWTRERRAAMRDLLHTFVDDGQLASRRHARFERAMLSALAGDPQHPEAGSTPTLFGGKSSFTLGLDALGAATTAEHSTRLAAGGYVDWVPLRTPLTFLPAGFDFLTLDTHFGLAAMLPFVGAERVSKTFVEMSVAPALTTFFDDLPNLALTVELLSWRPSFAFGESCRAFSSACMSMARVSEGAQLSFWPFRDPAFGVDKWPALYAGARVGWSPRSGPLGGVRVEGSVGASATF